MRSGWNSSSASSFSPHRANMIGLPVTARTESAAPPRASPSSFVRIDAVEVDRVEELLGDVDGVLAGHRVEHEQDVAAASTRLRDRARARPSGRSSTCSRPAVSTMTTSRPCEVAASTPQRGDRRPDRRRCRGRRRARRPARPSVLSCSMAAGRCRSQATSAGLRPCLTSRFASLPAVVVLPEPCRPQSRITVGGLAAKVSFVPGRAEQLGQLLVDDLDDLLAGRQALRAPPGRRRARAPRRRTS